MSPDKKDIASTNESEAKDGSRSSQWMEDIEEALNKTLDIEILPQFKPRKDATYHITVLDDQPSIVKLKNPKFSDTMFILKVSHDGMEKSFNVTSKSARLSLAKILKQHNLTSLRGLTLIVQKTEGMTKYGKTDLYQMQLAK